MKKITMKRMTIPRLSQWLLVAFCLVGSLQVSAQIKASKAVSTPTINLEKLVQQKNSDYVITSEHTSKLSGIHHKYVRQAINGIEIFGTESSVHTNTQGKAVMVHNNFVGDIRSTITSSEAAISEAEAIASVAQQMGYDSRSLTSIVKVGTRNNASLYSGATISVSDIPVKKMYYYREGIGTQLIWELSIEEFTSADWWNFRVDAATGTIIDKDNFTQSCMSATHDHAHDENNNVEESIAHTVENTTTMMAGAYNVYAMPIESPNHGGRSLVTDPDDATASPFGWHDTNGAAGAESNYTIGNNCDAYDDTSSTISGTGSGTNAERAFGGASLNFDYPMNTDVTVGDGSIDAAVTNLFYWTNIIHDVTYQYGFDEASGNFQVNNYGNGGVAGDSVRAEAQDGSGTCNANFSTPTDGGRGRMQMYVCGTRDGDLDNGVVIHEYGHGISTRLTGGAGNSSGLNNREQMGEGWSDFFGLMLTMEPGDQGTDVRGIGTWLVGEAATGPGIRTYPYSTDFGINSLTYDDINAEAIPHGVGSVWCSTLWDMTWLLIEEYGYSTDFYTVTGDETLDAGNVQAIALVMEGLKLQGASPGFESGRDAIIAADNAIYGGANACIIWEAFAKRGMGFSADEGSTNDENDGTAAFDLPPTVGGFENSISNACLTGGTLTGLTGGFPTGGTYSGTGVTNTGGNTYSFDPSVAGTGTHVITYTVNDFCNSNASTAFNQTIDVQNDTLSLTCPGDITIESDTNATCSAEVVYTYPAPEGDLCNRTVNGVSQNTNTTINNALDCTDAASGHLRSFNLTTQGITRDYTIDGVDLAINDNSAGVSPITVNLYLASQISGGISGQRVPLSGAVKPYASAVSLVPSGTGFIHNVPLEVFLPAGTSFHIEVLTPSSRNSMLGYNDAGGGNPANETTSGFINCVGANYVQVSLAGFSNLAAIIEVTGSESNEYTTTQTAGLVPGSTFTAGTTTNTFMTSAQSGGSTTCSFDVTVIGKTTIYEDGVWTPVLPEAGSNAKFTDSYSTADGDIDACSCEIDAAATVTVNDGEYMDVYGDITVNGSLIVQPGGSVVQTEDAAVVTNNGTINVNVVTPTLASRDFMIMGSPMTAETRSGVFTDAFLVLNFNPDDFIANTAVPAGGTNWADDNGDFYSTHTGAINPGEGYVVRPQTGYGAPGGIFNMTYELGTMNNGVVTYSNFNNNPTPANNTPNVVANPYPSAILADDFMTVNSLTALYFWEHITPPGTGLPGSNLRFDMDDISIRNMGMGMPSANGGAAPTNFISTGQGFGVRTANAAPGVNGTITFNNSMRSTTGNNTLRRPAPSLTETITLEVRNTTTGVGGFTGVAFTDNATEQYDEGYDTNRLATIVSLFSHLPNGGEELGIQSREAFDTTITIPLGFETQIEKVVDYKISISDLEGVNIENATVYLMDHQTNQLSNLSQDSYSFSSTAGRYDSRFTLYFEEQIVLGDQDLALEAITVFPNPTESLLNVVSPTSNITSIEVYDVRGRQLQTIAGTNQTNYSLDLSSYDTAIYFVKIATEQGAITKRIVKQ